MTKTELARRMYTSRSSLCRVLNGDIGVTIKTLSKGAQAANLNLALGLTPR